MRKQQYNRLKSQIHALRRELKEERAANYERAAYDRRVINDLRQQLHASTVAKSTEMDALISKLHASAKKMAERARQEYAVVCEPQHMRQ